MSGARANGADGPPRLLEILQKAEGYLAQKECESPRLDAQVLLAHVLGCDRVRLYMDYEKPLAEEELGAYRELIRRRAAHEPVAYLTGEREFWSLPFRVDRRVLIPRPDSETLVEEALDLFRHGPPKNFADIGTGSGCLAAALGHSFPKARGQACDSQSEALELARENLTELGLAERVELRQGHLYQALGQVDLDLICANLPYIPRADMETLPADVRCYEPGSALDGGGDGLDFIREVVAQAHEHLSPGGWLLLEVGAGQADQVTQLCAQAGLTEIHQRADLAGVARVVAARRVSEHTEEK